VLDPERVCCEVLGDERNAGEAGNADSSRSGPMLMEDDGKKTKTTASCAKNASEKAVIMQHRNLPRILPHSAITSGRKARR